MILLSSLTKLHYFLQFVILFKDLCFKGEKFCALP